MASPTFQTKGAVTAFSSADGTQNIAVPSGTADGDLLIWVTCIGTSVGAFSMTWGSGFTPLDSLAQVAATTDGWDIRYRVASSEPASYTITANNAQFVANTSYLIRVSGIGGTPINASATKTLETGSGPLSIPTVTATETDTLLFSLAVQIDATSRTITAAGGLTGIHQQTSVMSSLTAYEAIAASGAVSGRTNTVSGSGTFSKYAFLISSGGSGGATTLTADQGSLSLTGQTASLKVARVLSAAQGSYSLTGQNATLTYEQPGVYTLTANQGSYLITGSDGLAQRAMNAEFGSYSLSGQEVSFSSTTPQDYSMPCEFGLYSYTGRSARLIWSGAPASTNVKTLLNIGMRIGL